MTGDSLGSYRTGHPNAGILQKEYCMALLITISQFCGEYGVSRSTAYRLRDRGDVPHVKIGRATRIRREDAERWYQSLEESAAND